MLSMLHPNNFHYISIIPFYLYYSKEANRDHSKIKSQFELKWLNPV